MLKRILLWTVMNIFVMVTISLILNFIGVTGYITPYGIDYSSLMIFCLVWGMAGSFISLALSKVMAKWTMGLKIVDERSNYGHLVLKVHRLARAAGLSKMPEVAIYDSPEPNAFATGPTRNNSLVAVSTGLLSRMTDDEVEGVLGHEVGHIANGDMVTMTLLQGVINAFVLFFSKIVSFAITNALRGNSDRSEGSPMLRFGIEMVLQILFGFLGMIVLGAFSRFREYRADQAGAKLAGKDKMIGALKKLKVQMDRTVNSSQHPEREEPQGIAAFKISNRGRWLSLLSTHPPLEDRIRALEMSR